MPSEVREQLRGLLRDFSSGYPSDKMTDIYLNRILSVIGEEIEKAIDIEPELPGDMPDDMWEVLKNDKELCTESHRLTVRKTKENIKNRILTDLRARLEK